MRNLLAIVAFVAIFGAGYDLVTRVTPKISDSILTSVSEQLPRGTRHGADITVSGRDITISGLLHDQAEAETLQSVLSTVPGQRVVTLGDVTFLPVAEPYAAALSVSDAGVVLKTHIPDEQAETDLSLRYADAERSYAMASGEPDDAWLDILSDLPRLVPLMEEGQITLEDRKLALSGLLKSRAAEADIVAFAKALPDAYALDVSAAELPPLYDVVLSKSAEGDFTLKGIAPKGVALDDAIAALIDAPVAATDLRSIADPDAESLQPEIARLAPIFKDLRSFDLRLRGAADVQSQLQGLVEPNVDLDAFNAQRSALGLENAALKMPEQFTVEFSLDAETGAQLAGVAPDGFDPEALAESLGIEAINVDNFASGARGDASTLAAQIAALKPIVQDVETLTVGLEGQEGEVTPVAEVEAETLPRADPSRVADLLRSILTTVTEPRVAVTTKTYENGQTRVNKFTGVREQYQNGFWVPLLVVTETTPEGCKKVTDHILSENEILFAAGVAQLDATARTVINRLAGAVLSCLSQTELNLLLSGHTDNLGDPAANLQLSELRVNTVRDALTDRGVTETRMETIGYGDTRPIADNSTREGRRKNRRTDFDWLF